MLSKSKNNPRSPKSLRAARRQGFTLIEVLVAVAILSMIFSMVQVILISTITARDFVQEQTHVDRIGTRLLSLISQDIHAAYLYQLEEPSFVGKSEREGDRLDFVTNTDSFLNGNDSKSDLCEVGYFLKPNPEEAYTYKLLRREDYFMDENLAQGGYAIKLYDRVASLEFRYIDKKGASHKDWNSKTEKGLPQAVLITLGLYTAKRGAPVEVLLKSIQTFPTCVPILVSSTMPEKKKKEKKE